MTTPSLTRSTPPTKRVDHARHALAVAWLRTSALSALTTEVVDHMDDDEIRTPLTMLLPWLRRSLC